MIEVVEVDPFWITAMIICAAIGVVVNVFIILRTMPLIFTEMPQKGKIAIFCCILVFAFNCVACLIWVLLRTDLLIHLSINSCQYIYVINFLCYFIAKYILHCLLIGRIYFTFQGTGYAMDFRLFSLYLIIVSLHFFAAAVIWVGAVESHVLKGTWGQHSICTLFSNNANNAFTVKCAAVSMGAEDFIVSGVTLYILVKRLRSISKNCCDPSLLHKAIRYANVASVAMISTLFLFTLAVPFWPNVTFITPLDAIINSLCIFCVLSIGHKTYNCLFLPLRMCQVPYFGSESTQINVMIIHKEATPKNAKVHETVRSNTSGELEIVVVVGNENVMPIKLNKRYSEPLYIKNVLKEMMGKESVSNPSPYI